MSLLATEVILFSQYALNACVCALQQTVYLSICYRNLQSDAVCTFADMQILPYITCMHCCCLQLYLAAMHAQTCRYFQPSGSVAGRSRNPARAELLLSVLVEFWLTDGAEPVPRDPRVDPPVPAYAAKAPTEQSLLDAVQVRRKFK